MGRIPKVWQDGENVIFYFIFLKLKLILFQNREWWLKEKKKAQNNKCSLFSLFTYLVHLNEGKLNCSGQILINYMSHCPFRNRFIKDRESNFPFSSKNYIYLKLQLTILLNCLSFRLYEVIKLSALENHYNVRICYTVFQHIHNKIRLVKNT